MRLRIAGITLALALLALVTPVRAGITFYDEFKTTSYTQTSSVAPATPIGYFGSLGVSSNNSTDLNGATVAITGATPPSETLAGSNGNYGYSTPGFAAKASMDAILPNGSTYTFTLNGGTLDGQTASFTSPSSDRYASTVPYFTGATYSLLQNFNASNAITLTFNGYAPNVSNTPLTFLGINRVSDGAFIYGTSGDNTLNSADVAAGTLQAGTTYDLSLVYSNRDSFGGTFPGSTEFVSYDVRTDLIFTTAPAPVPEPSSLVMCGIAGAIGMVVARVRRKRVV